MFKEIKDKVQRGKASMWAQSKILAFNSIDLGKTKEEIILKCMLSVKKITYWFCLKTSAAPTDYLGHGECPFTSLAKWTYDPSRIKES